MVGRNMTQDDPYADRKQLTFEQAEGAEALPAPLQLKEISSELRSKLWAVIFQSLEAGSREDERVRRFEEKWRAVLYDKHIRRDFNMADEFANDFKKTVPHLKRIFTHGDYLEVFGFLQFVIRSPKCPHRLAEGIDWALSSSRAAYRVVDGKTIIPTASDAERAALERAFADLASIEFRGARGHLRKAGELLTSGKCADSIRESINSVESVARVLAPNATTLGPALSELEKRIRIHKALRSGFDKLYGFTSDEQGLRHALIDEPEAPVDETDAIFMLGSCAAFVSYLINKARIAGLLGK
jgi:hypothetical protein